MTRWAIWLGLGGVALAFGALLFAWSGVYNVSASSGHFSVTRWFLHFTMRNSVETHAMGIKVPALDDPALLPPAAGHYATGCEPCHGGPGIERERIMVEMVPPPPPLVRHVEDWEAHELFWLVKHGLKYTAMPAWPARARDDEVWAMTAFLGRLPDLTEAEYRRLTRAPRGSVSDDTGDPFPDNSQQDMAEALSQCVRCHGYDGAGRGSALFPRLDGQSEAYLYASLRAYAQGQRHSGFMQPVAERLTKAEMRSLARYFSRATASEPAAPEEDPDLVGRGAGIAAQGDAGAGLPACASCHGPGDAPRHPVYPSLVGQPQRYLAQQLRLFRQGARGGTAFAPIMAEVAKHLNDGQIEAVAAYYASLPRPRAQQRVTSPAAGQR